MPSYTNFFWATIFILYDPLEFSTGACPTPSGLEIGKTHHCALSGYKKSRNKSLEVKSPGNKSPLAINIFLRITVHNVELYRAALLTAKCGYSYTDRNILDNSYYSVKYFLEFPLWEYTIASFKQKLLIKGSNCVLP